MTQILTRAMVLLTALILWLAPTLALAQDAAAGCGCALSGDDVLPCMSMLLLFVLASVWLLASRRRRRW